MSDPGFVRIRIREEDYNRVAKRVTLKKKVYHVVAEALDALEKVKK